jgi:alkanesulfonate monooxygenase SsuD/methylene tetrahydromethanopterin reductase-like flavin-dependent oxidoreductase (luciferase family)
MAGARRQLHFNAFQMSCGHHEAAWRLPESDPFASLDLAYWTNLARIAERGTFDSLFPGRRPGAVGPRQVPSGRGTGADGAAHRAGRGDQPDRAHRHRVDQLQPPVQPGPPVRLWDSWEDGAELGDKAAGVYADDGRIHEVGYQGEFFKVGGPLNLPRSPQGHPLLVQA